MAQSNAERMLPILAKAFGELGYRRATTAVLARRCGVRENVMYRVWPSKKSMFVDVIDFVWRYSLDGWREALGKGGTIGPDAAQRILEFDSGHRAESRLYRIVFAGLTESDDPDIAAALQKMYQNFHSFVTKLVTAARRGRRQKVHPDATDSLTAWVLVGLATVANIAHLLELMPSRERSLLYTRVGKLLIQGP